MSFGARALIRLGAIKHNLGCIRSASPDSKVMAVIKANAYGHGMLAVARHLDDVDAFAVARLTEALQLRKHGIDKPVVLLAGVMNEPELRAAARFGFEPVVHCTEQLVLLQGFRSDSLIVWAKFDTGMNRLGFAPAEAQQVLDALSKAPAVRELRLMTHLSSADETDSNTTMEQVQRFRPIVADFAGDVSIGNTPGTLGWPDIADARRALGFHGNNWIRPGVALFGISPFADRSGIELGLRPVMQFEARLIAAKRLEEGDRVGYKGAYISDRNTRLGIISAGYGDGYTRHFRSGTPVLINGRRVPLIGNVSMDMIAVDLGPDSSDAFGDIATLWGDGLPVEEVAAWADAIPYELVCGVMNREDNEYVKS